MKSLNEAPTTDLKVINEFQKLDLYLKENYKLCLTKTK